MNLPSFTPLTMSGKKPKSIPAIAQPQDPGRPSGSGSIPSVAYLEAANLICEKCDHLGMSAFPMPNDADRRSSFTDRFIPYAVCPECGFHDRLADLQLVAKYGRCDCGNPRVMSILDVVECPLCEGVKDDAELRAEIRKANREYRRRA